MKITKKDWAGIIFLLAFGGYCAYLIVNANTILAYVAEKPEYAGDVFIPYIGLVAVFIGIITIIKEALGGKG